MKSAPLTRDMVGDPANWRLSMMLADTALEVVARTAVGERASICASIQLDRSLAPAAAIEEAIYANPLLLQPFGKVDILIRTDRFQILPQQVAESAEAVEAVLEILPHPEGSPATIGARLDGRNSIVAMLDRGVANFIGRTFYQVRPVSHLAVLSTYFTHRSRMGNSGKLYVNLYADCVDILAYNSLGLTAANTFACPDDSNAVYYVLAAAKQIGFDFAADEIYVSGNSERRATLMPQLRRFAANVMPAIFPATAFGGDHNALSAPFELIILPLCE